MVVRLSHGCSTLYLGARVWLVRRRNLVRAGEVAWVWAGIDTNLIDTIRKDISVIKDCIVNDPWRGAAVLLGLLPLSRNDVSSGGEDHFFPSTFVSTRLFSLERVGFYCEVGDALLLFTILCWFLGWLNGDCDLVFLWWRLIILCCNNRITVCGDCACAIRCCDPEGWGNIDLGYNTARGGHHWRQGTPRF
jgi:hypothetical protein